MHYYLRKNIKKNINGVGGSLMEVTQKKGQRRQMKVTVYKSRSSSFAQRKLMTFTKAARMKFIKFLIRLRFL